MSLINVFLSPSKALVGVDTEVSGKASGELSSASKMIHIPHANVVMAGRGMHVFMLTLFGIISQLDAQADGENGNIDSLANVMPYAFEQAYALLKKNIPANVDRAVYEEQQIVLVGWSNQQNRMRGVAFSKSSAEQELDITEIKDPGYIMPWNADWGDAPDGNDAATMERTAKLQTQNVKRESPATAMGGRLMLAELMRTEMSFKSIDGLSIGRPGPILFTAEELRKLGNGSADADLKDRLTTATSLINQRAA